MMKRIAIFSIIALLIFGACSRRPRYVMPENKMVDVLIDIQLAQAMYSRGSQFNTDIQRDALIEGVLKKHKITQSELDSSLMWYSDNIEYYETISDSVSSKLKARNNQFSAYLHSISGRTTSSHLIPVYFHLNKSTPIMAFDIDSFKIKNVDVPKFRLKFNVQGLSSLQKLEAAVFFTYKDTLVKEIVPIDNNRQYVFDKPLLADSLLKSITGYVHLRSRAEGLPFNVTLYNISYIDSVAVTTIGQEHRSLDEPVPAMPERPKTHDRAVDVSSAQEVEAEVEVASSPEKNSNK